MLKKIILSALCLMALTTQAVTWKEIVDSTAVMGLVSSRAVQIQTIKTFRFMAGRLRNERATLSLAEKSLEPLFSDNFNLETQRGDPFDPAECDRRAKYLEKLARQCRTAWRITPEELAAA